MHAYIHTHIHIYIHIRIYIYLYIIIHMGRGRFRELFIYRCCLDQQVPDLLNYIRASSASHRSLRGRPSAEAEAYRRRQCIRTALVEACCLMKETLLNIGGQGSFWRRHMR